MSGTKRIPIRRPEQRPTITPHAVGLFTAMEQAAFERSSESCIRGAAYGVASYCSKGCASWKEWYRLHDLLHEELQRALWDWPCIVLNPHAPGTAEFREWQPARDTEQYALWYELEMARHERGSQEEAGAA